MSRLWAALVAGVAAVGAGRADEPPPPAVDIPTEQLAKARLLVRQLGSPSYHDREDATAELAKLGRVARSALAEAVATSPDYEVRARAARLLPKAEAADLQIRIAAFVADADGKLTHDLPAWDKFREHVGGDRSCRALFAEMLKATENRDVLAAVAASKRDGGAAIAHRRLTIFLAQNPHMLGGFRGGVMPPQKQPTLADISTVLFGETVVPSADIPRGGQFVYVTGATLAVQTVSQQTATSPAANVHGEAYKKLLLRWLDTRTSPEDLGGAVNVAQAFGQLKDMTPLFRRVATTDAAPGQARGQALVYLVQRNKKTEHPFLKTQLKNEAVVTQVGLGQNPMGMQILGTCQMRDVALALLLAETGQNLHEYGFGTAQGAVVNPVGNAYPTYAFPDDDARDRALRKWADWEATHPIPPFDPGPPAKK